MYDVNGDITQSFSISRTLQKGEGIFLYVSSGTILATESNPIQFHGGDIFTCNEEIRDCQCHTFH